MNPTASITTASPPALPEIPGVDILATRELPSKPVAGPFYTDQLDALADVARAVRDRARQGLVFIAPEGIGFTIFKRVITTTAKP